MPTPLHLLRLKNTPIYEQLLLEEALLRTDDRSFCIINTGSKPACVLGISSNTERMIDLKQAEAIHLPIIRRFSGGGTVVVDESTCFITFILNTKAFDIHHNPDGLHAFINQIYIPFFQPLPFSFHENDYRLEERKMGGNAQYFTKDRALHHTSFLYDWQKSLMALLKMPPKMPKYREFREHEEFLVTLKSFYPSTVAFLDQFEAYLRQTFEVIGVDFEEALLKKPHRTSVEKILPRG